MKNPNIPFEDSSMVGVRAFAATQFLRRLLPGLLALGAAVTARAEPEPVLSAAADLNGDGSTEQVTLIPEVARPSGGPIHGKLRIGKAEIELTHEEGPAKVRIVDISHKDGQKEIEVHCHGPSDHIPCAG